MATSRGAWPHYYTLGLDYRSDPQGREAYGIYALKQELIYNNFAKGVVSVLPYWGKSAVAQTKNAQKFFGIQMDGVLGPETARYLFRKRLAEQKNGDLLSQIKSLESDNDPVAQGYEDLDDEGLFQENLPSNPDLTQVQCWTPSFIVPHAASQLASRIKSCGSKKAGVAGWNIGNEYATEWRKAGYPASGKIVEVDGEQIDMFARATTYYADVTKQAL